MISIQMSKSRCNLFTIEYFSEFKFIFLSIAHMCAFQVLIFWGFSYSFRKFFSHDLSKIIVISILILSNNCFVFHSLSSHFNIIKVVSILISYWPQFPHYAILHQKDLIAKKKGKNMNSMKIVILLHFIS